MYELWLMLNIVWEIALGVWPWLLGLGLVWLALVAAALARAPAPSSRPWWPRAWRVAVVAGLAAFALALVAVPTLTRASLTDLAYGADWLALGGIAFGGAVVAALFALPIARLLLSSTPHQGALS
jgi:hypothetical protein